MPHRPIVTLSVGGRAVPLTRAALERMSPDVLLPLADLKELDAQHNHVDIDCAGLEDGIAALHAYLHLCSSSSLAANTSARAVVLDLLKQDDANANANTDTHTMADVHAHKLADKYGLPELMRLIEAERVVRRCVEKRATVQEVLARFDWHPAVVQALMSSLQTLVDHHTQVADVVRVLSERAVTLVVCEQQHFRGEALAKGCVVVCWDKCGLPHDRLAEQYDLPWMQKVHAGWIDAINVPAGSTRQPRHIAFTVLEPHKEQSRLSQWDASIDIDINNSEQWFSWEANAATAQSSIKCHELGSLEELERFVRARMFLAVESKGSAVQRDKCLVELMV